MEIRCPDQARRVFRRQDHDRRIHRVAGGVLPEQKEKDITKSENDVIVQSSSLFSLSTAVQILIVYERNFYIFSTVSKPSIIIRTARMKPSRNASRSTVPDSSLWQSLNFSKISYCCSVSVAVRASSFLYINFLKANRSLSRTLCTIRSGECCRSIDFQVLSFSFPLT